MDSVRALSSLRNCLFLLIPTPLAQHSEICATSRSPCDAEKDTRVSSSWGLNSLWLSCQSKHQLPVCRLNLLRVGKVQKGLVHTLCQQILFSFVPSASAVPNFQVLHPNFHPLLMCSFVVGCNWGLQLYDTVWPLCGRNLSFSCIPPSLRDCLTHTADAPSQWSLWSFA